MIHPAMDAEAIRRVAEAHHVAGAAMYRLADAIKEMGDITQPVEPKPAPAPEPEPGEWRNDRAPKECEADDDGKLWIWCGDWPLTHPAEKVHWDAPTHFLDLRYWAPGNLPAPKSPPPDVVGSREPEPQPDTPPEPNESPVRHWIIDRPPTEEDDWVAISVRPGTDRSGFEIVDWCYAYPGTPWAPVGAIPDEPFNPTCLDRNGWIRSRLPTVEDANGVGVVLIPVGRGDPLASINYHLIVPGQPWAPWGSNPGGFEK